MTQVSVLNQKRNSVAWVRERTKPTNQPSLVGEVIAHFSGERVPRGQRDGSLGRILYFSRQKPLLFFSKYS
jgi:hypothetical protein